MTRRLVLLAAALAVTAPALADWPPGGARVANFYAFNKARDARIWDHPSGDLAVLSIGAHSVNNTHNVQRVLRSGGIAAGWPDDGVQLSATLRGTQYSKQSFVVDGDGWFLRSWPNSDVRVQLVGPDGDLVPATSPYYYSLGSATLCAHVAPGSDEDFYVTRASDRLLRVRRDGVYPPGWTSSGITLPSSSAYLDNAVIADGHGGAVVFMRIGGPSLLPIATRIDSNKVRNAAWPADGLALGSTPVSVFDNSIMDSQLLPSGPDHVIAAWTAEGAPGKRQLWIQRFGLDATLDPAWPAGGLQPFGPDTLRALTLLPDGSGGVYVLRQLGAVPVVTRVSSDGTVLGGAGAPIADAAAQYVPTYVYQQPGEPDHIVADRTPNGGLVVGWGDTRLAPTPTFRVRWLQADLTPDPTKPDTGVVVYPASPGTDSQSLLAIHADGDGAAFVAWGGWELKTGYEGQLWMTRVEAPAPVGVEEPRARTAGFALSAARPNPARGRVAVELTLPDADPARVTLVDLAGRVLRTREVIGAGMHAVAFDDLHAMPPGLYFVCARLRGEPRSVRVAIAR